MIIGVEHQSTLDKNMIIRILNYDAQLYICLLYTSHILNKTLCYEVDSIVETVPDDTSALAVQEGKDLVSLLTCTPVSYTHLDVYKRQLL